MNSRTNSVTEAVGSTLNTVESGRLRHFSRIFDGSDESRLLRWVTTIIVFAVFLFLVWTVQQKAGAPAAAFGGFPDEPAHYVGGLVTRDYVVNAFGKDPISYVQKYHVRLPYFALGVWPPLFYALEGGWMEVFGDRRASVLWMIAVSAAGLATLLFRMLKKDFDFWTAAAGAAVFLFIPIVQWSACLVMVDLTCSLLVLASIVFFARFVERGRWQDSALLGIFCGLSLLMKNSTYYVVLVPPLVVAASRRWDLLRNRALWIAPAMAAVIYVPWLFLTRSFLLLGIHGLQIPGFLGIQRDYAVALWHEIPGFFPLGIAGGIVLIFSKRHVMSAFSMCMLAVIPAISIGIFFARVPVQDRLLMVSYWACIFLAAELCAVFLPPRKRAGVMIVCAIIFGYSNWMNFSRPPANRIRPAVAYIQLRDKDHPGAVLVPSGNEGPWIAEFAQTEPKRPMRIMLRPTKVFGTEDWNGTNWQPYYQSADELDAFFQRTPVKYCILASSNEGRRYPHDQLLESVVAGNPAQWRVVFQPDKAAGGEYRIYENMRWTPASEQTVYTEMNKLWMKYLP